MATLKRARRASTASRRTVRRLQQSAVATNYKCICLASQTLSKNVQRLSTKVVTVRPVDDNFRSNAR